MTARDYYRHARSLGSFRAIDALRLAREAASLDEKARVSVPPATVAREVMPDGTAPVNLSFGVTVY
ncbi:hypothetical protein [Rhizobium phage RHph_X2_26]|nr:hypothetical protein [Rhizobium phage RHph_X2_26]